VLLVHAEPSRRLRRILSTLPIAITLEEIVHRRFENLPNLLDVSFQEVVHSGRI
jgi:hypothetical protein